MAKIAGDSLTKWEFVDDVEERTAHVFNDLNEMHIQNYMVDCIHVKANMGSDTYATAEEYIRAQEYERGKIAALVWLLAASASAKEDMIKTRQAAGQTE